MSNSKPTVFCLGANHKTADIHLRESLHLGPEAIKMAMPKVAETHHLSELAVLSTCNRFELFGVYTGQDLLEGDLHQAVLDMHQNSGSRPAQDLTVSLIRANTYLYLDREAASHIFSVASSLDSLVVGETQITGQFKDAIQIARESETLGPVLHRLCQEALSTAKKVRSKTDISKKPVSISHAAIDLAKKVFGDLREHRFLILGAGEMARIAAQHALNSQPLELLIANRNLARAEDLANFLNAGRAFSLDAISTLLTQADVVIAATGATRPILHHQTVERAALERRGKPLFLVDIGIPRNIDPQCSDIEDVYLFDIDDLQQVVETHQQARKEAAVLGQEFIQEAAGNFESWLNAYAIKPVLSDFHGYVKDVVQREAQRTLSKECFSSLSDQQKSALDGLFQAIGSRLVGDASRNLKNPGPGYYPDQLAAALRQIFLNPSSSRVINDPKETTE